MQIQCKAILMVLKPSVNLGNDLENPDSLSGFFLYAQIFSRKQCYPASQVFGPLDSTDSINQNVLIQIAGRNMNTHKE